MTVNESPYEGLHRLHLIMGVQCNVRCTMCYQTDFSPKFNMPPQLYEEKLGEAYKHVTSVKLQGGEPTVMKNCRDAAVLLRAHEQVKLTVITNGVFVDDFWHATFVEQGGNVSVSINAATEAAYDKIVVHGDYPRVIKNLERLLAARKGKTPSVGVTAVILKENFHELHEIIDLVSAMGLDYVEFLVDPILSFAGLPGRDAIRSEMERCRDSIARSKAKVIGLDDFGKKFALPLLMGGPVSPKKPMCGAPFDNLVIDWNGDVRVCCNTWVRAGNLYQSSLAEILHGRSMHSVQDFQGKMKDGDYGWCSPSCSDNAAPTKRSLAHKYVYELASDPKNFVDKVKQKVKQLQGKWIVPKKRSTPILDPKRRRLPLVEDRQSDAGPAPGDQRRAG